MNNSVVTHIFGYLLGLLIFVIGIPALMWLVSGRPWPYVPDSAIRCTASLLPSAGWHSASTALSICASSARAIPSTPTAMRWPREPGI